MLLDGRPVHFRSPMEARAAGIETVYQNLALSPALSIADNMFLGRERRKPGIVGHDFPPARPRARCGEEAREHLNDLGLLTIQNIHQPVETLSGGQRQGVAVARAAAFGSRVIIMDEPTAALGVKESRKVLELMLGAEEARPADHPDQPQHAARLRGRRPHPHPPARPAHRGDRPEGLFHVGRGRHHDRRDEAAGSRWRREPMRCAFIPFVIPVWPAGQTGDALAALQRAYPESASRSCVKPWHDAVSRLAQSALDAARS